MGFNQVIARTACSSPTPLATQTTSVNTNNGYLLQRPWDDNMPSGAFTITYQAKVASWATGPGIDGPIQNIMTVNCSDECIQIFAQVDGSTNTIWTWQGEDSAPSTFTELYGVSNYSGWALYSIRNNGLGGSTEVVMIPHEGSPIVQTMLFDFGPLRQWYIQGFFSEKGNQIYGCTAILYEEYLSNADLIAQSVRDQPLAGKTVNTFYPMSDASTAYVDQSGNGYDALFFNTGATVNDSPY